MDNIFFNQKTPEEINKGIAKRIGQLRKRKKLSQEKLSIKSGVSLGYVKRFETTGEISLKSLTKIAIALEAEGDLIEIFSKPPVKSIEEIINGHK